MNDGRWQLVRLEVGVGWSGDGMNKTSHVAESRRRTVLLALLAVVRVVAIIHETRLRAMAFFISGWDEGMETNGELL